MENQQTEPKQEISPEDRNELLAWLLKASNLFQELVQANNFLTEPGRKKVEAFLNEEEETEELKQLIQMARISKAAKAFVEEQSEENLSVLKLYCAAG